jgi:putative addiction module antidote
MIRRLFKTGNSVVISLPKEILESLGLSDGENVSLELDRQRQRLIITPSEKSLAVVGVDEDFSRYVNEFIEQYRPALDQLAK